MNLNVNVEIKGKPLKSSKEKNSSQPFLPFFMRSSTSGDSNVRSGNVKANSFVVATATPYPARS